MTAVVAEASVSLDGFIAGPNETGFEHLFEWHGNGNVEIPAADHHTFRVGEASAGYIREMLQGYGALVVGRRLFDVTNGWNGLHPLGAPVFVVTHRVPEDWRQKYPDAPFTFVTEGGVQRAIELAKRAAGAKKVGLGPGSLVRQGLEAGLIDEVRLCLVPVLLGKGTRAFDELANAPILFDNPQVIEGDRVTHLIYRRR